MDDLPELRADVPALEPDPVLLGQLVELSAASTAAARRSPLRPARTLAVGAAAFGLVAATSWIAGALPGLPSPISPDRTPRHAPGAPATPSRSSDGRIPGTAVATTPGASRPHTEAPGAVPPRHAAGSSPTGGWVPPGAEPTPPAGDGGRAVGRSPSKHPDQGRHIGQQPTKGRDRVKKTSAPRPSATRRPTSRPTSGPTTGP